MTRQASTSVPGQHIFEPLVSNRNHGRQVLQKRLAGSTYWLRDKWFKKNTCLCATITYQWHTRVPVCTRARLNVPMLAATPPRWGGGTRFVRFSRAGRMPSQDVVLPLRSMVAFCPFSSVAKFVHCCSLDCCACMRMLLTT